MKFDVVCDGMLVAEGVSAPASSEEHGGRRMSVNRGPVTAIYGDWKVWLEDVVRYSLEGREIVEHRTKDVPHFSVHDHTNTHPSGGDTDILHTRLCALDLPHEVQIVDGAFSCANWLLVVHLDDD